MLILVDLHKVSQGYLYHDAGLAYVRRVGVQTYTMISVAMRERDLMDDCILALLEAMQFGPSPAPRPQEARTRGRASCASHHGHTRAPVTRVAGQLMS